MIYDEILRIKELAVAKYQTVEDDIKRWMRKEGTVEGTIDKLNAQPLIKLNGGNSTYCDTYAVNLKYCINAYF